MLYRITSIVVIRLVAYRFNSYSTTFRLKQRFFVIKLITHKQRAFLICQIRCREPDLTLFNFSYSFISQYSFSKSFWNKATLKISFTVTGSNVRCTIVFSISIVNMIRAAALERAKGHINAHIKDRKILNGKPITMDV